MADVTHAHSTQRRSMLAFFRYFLMAYPARSLTMVALLAVAGFLDGISVVTLVPLMNVAAGARNGGTGGVSGHIAAVLMSVGLKPTLGVLLSIIVLAITGKSVLLWAAMRQVGYTVARITLDLRLQLIRSLLRARWSYFGSEQVGKFANAISSEAIRSASAYKEACVVLAGLFQVAAYLVVSTLISWQVTVGAIGAGAVLLLGLRRLMRMARSAGQDQTDLTKSLTGRLVDALQGIKPVKAMAREELFWPLLESEAEGLNQAHRRQVLAAESLRLFQEPVVTAVLAVGLMAFLTLTDRSFSAIVVLAFVFYRLMTQVNTLQMRYQVMSVGESAFWSLRDHIDRATEEAERHAGSVRPNGLGEALELREVSFSYGERDVLQDVSFRVPAGSFTAIVGPSGSGKTTILDLITGLRDPAVGEITVDGVSLADLDMTAWRSSIGYVPQEVFLFHDTIRRNVTLGDESIGKEAVVKALQDAGAWSFVSTRPGGIEDMIAPQGSNLSGGQRQRLAIARALVKRPTMLILDEATTGLDPVTEAAIIETLRTLVGRVTILAISHQPALQNAADTVIQLEHGRVRVADAVEAAARRG